MTDIEINHFLANFEFGVDCFAFHFNQNMAGQWELWIVMAPFDWYYKEVLPRMVVKTEDDLVSWIVGFGIRAFAAFLPSSIRRRESREGKWEPILYPKGSIATPQGPRSNHAGLVGDKTEGTSG